MIDRTRYRHDAEPRAARPLAPERPYDMERPRDEATLRLVGGGAGGQALLGLVTVVLASLGIAGILPAVMSGAAAICFGAALFLEGTAVAARFAQVVELTRAGRGDRPVAEGEHGGGLALELLGGAVALVLGIVVLVGITPAVLAPVAAIVGGTALLLGSSATSRLSLLHAVPGALPPSATDAVAEQVAGAAGLQAVLGLAAVVLGTLAIIGVAPATLTFSGFICIGVSELISGGAISNQVARLTSR